MALLATLSYTPDENAITTLYALLKGLRARVTRTTVRESMEQHPDFPSLLSLSDVLTDWNIDNTALHLNTAEQFRELPFPFIAHTHKNNGWYVLVTSLQSDTITYTDSQDGHKTESLADFEKKWSGVVLLAEANEWSGEADYAIHRKEEILDELRGPFILTGIVVVFLFVILSIAKNLIFPDWILLSSKTIGLMLSGLLVAKQLGNKNALTDRLCRINSKINCDDVLNSPAAKLWGWLSWADVGLLYFAGGLLTVFVVSVSLELRPLLYVLALLALPYTIFSIYYQGVALRNWCPLCLGVQGVLVLEGALAIVQVVSLPISWQPYMLILSAFLLITLVWVCVKPLLVHLPKNRQEHDELMRLKRNPELFQALLMQQPRMPPIPADLHAIVLGNPEAEHTITMVTNPYCNPCAKAHKELEKLLLRNKNVKATIIFVCDGENGRVTQVATHVIALTEQGSAAKALTDWHEQSKKNFDAWAERHPITPSSRDWIAVATKYSDWCRTAGISVTPTLFVDGYELPELYRLERLRWLINGLEPVRTKSQLSV